MSVIRYVGIAPEATYASETAPEAIMHMDIASVGLDVPSDTQIIYQGGLGRAPRTHRAGFYSPSGNIVYAFDIRTIGFLLKWALGGYSFTNGGGTVGNMHEVWGSNDRYLDSFVARVGKDYFEHVFHGCVINSLEIEVEGEFCQATVDIIAARDSKATIKDIQDLLLPTEYPLAFHEVTARRNGTDISTNIKSFTLSIENNLDVEAGRSIGSRHPRRIMAGDRQVSMDADLWYHGTSELERFWGGASGPSTSGAQEFGMSFTMNSGVHGTIEILLPRLVYNQVQQQPSGRDEIVQTIQAQSLAANVNRDSGGTVSTEIMVRIDNNEGTMA